VHAACGAAIARRERRRIVDLLGRSGVAKDPARWLREAEGRVMDVLAERGEAVGAEVTKADPRLARRFLLAPGSKWEAEVTVASRALLLLSMEGRIFRGRPRGTWISSQYRWLPTDRWFPDGMPHVTAEEARAELIRRWLAAYGPGTSADLRWWTGLTAGEVARALEVVKPAEVDLEGRAGWVLPDDVEPVRAPRPFASLLPSLDSTVMGWAERGWYLGEHAPSLFDRSGNAGPTVWWDGRVVGAWTHRPSGEVAFGLLEDVGADAVAAIEAEADRLQSWLGDVRVIPRFPTPSELGLRKGVDPTKG
jgi:hypothetical protein